jgi:putative ABC transport system permease protein
VSELLRDVRLALRSLRASPGFTLVAVGSLALGIGVNTGIFSLVDGVLFRPLPYREPDRLVVLWEKHDLRQKIKNVVSPANFLEWKRRNTAFEDMALSYRTTRTFTGADAPERLRGRAVTANFFALFGAAPALGRGFTPEEERLSGEGARATPVVLSWDLWKTRFGGDASAIGRSVRSDDGVAVIVGVMPREFRALGSEEYWEPVSLTGYALEFKGRYAVGWARLKRSVSVDDARRSLDAIARTLAAEHPDFDAGWTVQAVPLREEVVGDARSTLLVLFGTVTLVLLIACANLASLVLSRAAGREREVTIRLALGASRGRIARQAVTESLLLAFAGAAAGLVAARWSLDALVARAGDAIPRLSEVSVNVRAIAYSAAVATVVGIAFGLAPLYWRRSNDVAGALRGGGSRTTADRPTMALRGGLATVQIALSLVLVAGTGLLVRTMANLNHVELGFDPANVTTFRVILPDRYAGQKAPPFFEELVARLNALPGVTSAAAGSGMPFGGPDVGTTFSVDGRPEPPKGQKPVADIRRIDASYLATLKIPLLRGRALSERDREGTVPSALVDQSLAHQLFGDADPVGQRLAVDYAPPRGPVEIVGVVGDVRSAGLDEEPRPTVYLEQRQSPPTMMTIAVRSGVLGAPALPVIPAARRILADLDPDVAIDRVATLESFVSDSIGGRRLPMYFLVPFSTLALLLAAVGICGVLSLGVRQRMREIGIRIALGAAPRDVLRMVLGHAARIALTGAAGGALGALLTAGAMRSLLYGVAPSDPVTLAAAVLLVLAVALTASLLPARRAVATDPIAALRQE